ncbi:MAG: flagellar basal body-associated FliL family protein [Pseudomonadales bacterium]
MAEKAETSEEAVEAPRAKLGLVQILAIVGLVIVTQIVMKVVLDTFFPPKYVDPTAEVEEVAEEEEAVPVKDLAPANYLPLDPALVVNISHNGKSQYLQASVQLMTRSSEAYEAAKVHAPAIRNALIMLFSTADYDALSTVEGKRALQESSRARIDEVLEELAGVSGVDAIYFTSLVFQ